MKEVMVKTGLDFVSWAHLNDDKTIRNHVDNVYKLRLLLTPRSWCVGDRIAMKKINIPNMEMITVLGHIDYINGNCFVGFRLSHIAAANVGNIGEVTFLSNTVVMNLDN